MSVRFTIRAVAAKTGLSAHTIRAWERRYGVLAPDRTETNRRLYGQEDIEKLSLLKHAVDAGHSISQVANLTSDELISLDAGQEPAPAFDRQTDAGTSSYLTACEQAMDCLDGDSLEDVLVRGAAVLGVSGLLEEVILPFLSLIDRRWMEGSLRIAHEHLASAVLCSYLDRVRLSMSARPNAPRLLVTTPAGQVHEIGAQIVAIVAAMQGWHVTYLGPNLPAEEISAAQRLSRADALALSIVYPASDPKLPGELRLLRQSIGNTVPILIGGRAASSYSDVVEEIRASRVDSLAGLSEQLVALRTG